MTTSALSAQQYSDAKPLSTSSASSTSSSSAAPELRSSLNRARLALINLGQIDLNGYKPSLDLIRHGRPKSQLEGNIDTMFAWLAHGLRIANGIDDLALQQEILRGVERYDGQDLYLAYHLIQHNTLSMPGHTITPTLQLWLLGVIQRVAAKAETSVDLLRLAKIVQRFGLDIPYNHVLDAARRPPVFFSYDYIHDIVSALWMRSPEIDAALAPQARPILDSVYALRQTLQRYLRHCGVGVNLFLADTQNAWDGWIYCYLNDGNQVHELWASRAATPFPELLHFLHAVLSGQLPARFDWNEEGLLKTLIAEPSVNPNHFQFKLVADVEYSDTRYALIDADFDRFEFVSGIYAGLHAALKLPPQWQVPSASLETLKERLIRQQNRLR